ncbi:MAG: N-6 DNA methylase [Chloroflexi bacterium]|nr:N-6 DNA methylase [Chloroflexota bacterium]
MHCDDITQLRAEARALEQTLPIARRKALGQFFTGPRISRLLAHLAFREDTGRVLDPMAGTGDLIEAAYAVANERPGRIRQLHAVEIDASVAELCRRRLEVLTRGAGTDLRVLCADAFDAATFSLLAEKDYDLVIANPPYVRYQTMGDRGEAVRAGLLEAASSVLKRPVRNIWATLANGYSGLADLSVPSCLLCGMLVRPGGRLALVLPATWRTRNYGKVVRYLFLRAYHIETVVEDSPPGWFPDALVGTHLVVARRLSDEAAAVPLSDRREWIESDWVKLDRLAATHATGAGQKPNIGRLASWILGSKSGSRPEGTTLRTVSDQDEWDAIRAGGRPPAWLRVLEAFPQSPSTQRVKPSRGPDPGWLPHALRDVIKPNMRAGFCTLEDLGLRVGQGLRTGCNRFFYVQRAGEPSGELTPVTTSTAFESRIVLVPTAALRAVLHRQTELATLASHGPPTLVLDLRAWVLPEDMDTVNAALPAYERSGLTVPQEMPAGLANHVRAAALASLPGTAHSTVADLSAVRTNVRAAGPNSPPRFWYMLPDFGARHAPEALVPRINHDTPRTYANTDPKVLVDANFSTFWSDDARWSPDVLAALLNSTWCRLLVETMGAKLGGGALKLEASHLRQIPIPSLGGDALEAMKTAVRSADASSVVLVDRLVLKPLLGRSASHAELDALAAVLRNRAARARDGRRRSV